MEGIGEGAALSLTNCVLSFDGLASCGANDTVFANSHAGRKGGTASIITDTGPSQVEFHRCTVINSTTGAEIEDDPQGDGGAFAVNQGVTLVLSDCVLHNNHCGNKVKIEPRYGRGSTLLPTLSVAPGRGSTMPRPKTATFPEHCMLSLMHKDLCKVSAAANHLEK